MCLVLFSWLTDQQFFKELTDINTLKTLRQRTEEELMSELLPFGFFDDGMPDENVVNVDVNGDLENPYSTGEYVKRNFEPF